MLQNASYSARRVQYTFETNLDKCSNTFASNGKQKNPLFIQSSPAPRPPQGGKRHCGATLQILLPPPKKNKAQTLRFRRDILCYFFFLSFLFVCFSFSTGMRILVMLLLDTLPMLGNVLLLCFFVFFIFGIVGVQLWEGILRQRCFLKALPNVKYPE